MVPWRELSLGAEDVDVAIDDIGVFRMDGDQRPRLFRPLERGDDVGIIHHEAVFLVDHVELEARQPCRGRVREFFEHGGREVRERNMERIVDTCFRRTECVARLYGLANALPLALRDEVEDHRDAAAGRCPCAGEIIIGRCRAIEWELEMRVRIDGTGQHELARRIDGLRPLWHSEVRADGRDLFPFDIDICRKTRMRCDDRAATKHHIHETASLFTRCGHAWPRQPRHLHCCFPLRGARRTRHTP